MYAEQNDGEFSFDDDTDRQHQHQPGESSSGALEIFD